MDYYQVYTSNISTNPPAYRLGEKVALWYDPKDPQQVVLAGRSR